MGTTPPLITGSEQAPLTALGRDIRSNLLADLVVQAATILVYVFVVRSSWLLVLWLIRWIVIAAIAVASRFEGKGHRQSALWILISGHCWGVVATAIVLPEFAPVGVLVLIGDIALLVPHASGRRTRRLIGLLVGSATATGALSLQSWTGLADEAPRWLLVGFIAGHLIATGFAIITSVRAAEDLLRSQAFRLAAARSRAASASDQASLELRLRLDAGPARVLDELGLAIDDIETAAEQGNTVEARRLADTAADRAQQGLRELREISHGLFPDVLATGGLRPAVQALVGTTSAGGPSVRADVTSQRVHRSSENAVYGLVGCVLTAVQAYPNTAVDIVVTPAGSRLRFALLASGPPGAGAASPEVGSVTLDRVEAVGGLVTVDEATTPEGWSWRASGSVPIDIGSVTETVAAGFGPDDETVTLAVFLRFSAWFAGIGGVVVAIAYALTGVVVLLVIVGVLVVVVACVVLARYALGTDRPGLAAALLSAESSIAALSVTALVPEFAPVTAVISVLPMVVTPPGVSRRVVQLTVVGQTLTALCSTVLGVLGGIDAGFETAPGWLVAAVLPLATGGVAALVGASTSASLTRLNDLVAATQRSLTRLVTGADDERRRIERDLHDGAQQGLVALSLQCRAIAIVIAKGLPDRLAPLLAGARQQVATARSDLDQLSRGVFPRRLASGDLLGALTDAAAGGPVAVHVSATGGPIDDIHGDVAAGVYFACVEGMQNAAKHGGPGVTVTIDVRRVDDTVIASVVDDGPGLGRSTARPGRGLANIADRIGALGGRWTLSSPPGSGVRLDIAIPLPGGPGT